VIPSSRGTSSFRSVFGTFCAIVPSGDGAIDWLQSEIEGWVREQSDLRRGTE
jgi:hypothetical protein